MNGPVGIGALWYPLRGEFGGIIKRQRLYFVPYL